MATTSAVCDPTQAARQAHAAALGRLGVTDVELAAKETGARALVGVSTGCGEIVLGGR